MNRIVRVVEIVLELQALLGDQPTALPIVGIPSGKVPAPKKRAGGGGCDECGSKYRHRNECSKAGSKLPMFHCGKCGKNFRSSAKPMDAKCPCGYGGSEIKPL